MLYYVLKVVISALVIVAIAEISKRSTFLGGLLASLPLISILAFFWLYLDTRSVERVAALSNSIFWLVLPSLGLFVALPWLLRKTENFFISLSLSVGIMLALYGLMVLGLRRFNIQL